MEDIKFKIGEQEFLVKQTFRALLLFEEMTGEKYKSDTKLTPQFKMLYCMLKAANKEAFKFNYDEFIDTLDENQDSVQKFFDYITELSDKKKVVESQ